MSAPPAAKRACPPGALDTTVSNQSRASTLVPGLGLGTTANIVTWDNARGMHAQGYAAMLQNAEKRKRRQVAIACYTCRVTKVARICSAVARTPPAGCGVFPPQTSCLAPPVYA